MGHWGAEGPDIRCLRYHSVRRKYIPCFEVGLSQKGLTQPQNKVYTFAFHGLACVTIQCVRYYTIHVYYWRQKKFTTILGCVPKSLIKLFYEPAGDENVGRTKVIRIWSWVGCSWKDVFRLKSYLRPWSVIVGTTKVIKIFQRIQCSSSNRKNYAVH